VSRHEVIAIGASAGGVSALLELAAAWPPRLPAIVLVTLHVGANSSALPMLMTLRGNNPAMHAKDGDELKPGTIVVAPPDRHLLVHQGRVVLSHGPKEHHTRPAIDPMFRTVAIEYGPRAIGVILTGRRDDGAAGLRALKECGGLAVVQDPQDAESEEMPRAALQAVTPDACLPLDAIVPWCVRMLDEPGATPSDPTRARDRTEREMSVFAGEGNTMETLDSLGRPSKFTCPDCEGVLWQMDESGPPRFRCHTGHAFSLRSLEDTQAEQAEEALWSALRAMQQKETILRRLAQVEGADADSEQARRRIAEADRTAIDVQRLQSMLHSPTSP
jgi:two-component system chemotaxis response regulator CheB